MADDERGRLDRRQLLRGIIAGAVSLGFVAAASADVKDETYASNEDADGVRSGSAEGRAHGSEADGGTGRSVPCCRGALQKNTVGVETSSDPSAGTGELRVSQRRQ